MRTAWILPSNHRDCRYNCIGDVGSARVRAPPGEHTYFIVHPVNNNIMILIHFLIYHMVMADMRAHTNARTRTHTVFRHTLTGFVAALILCPPVTERFIPNDRRRSLPTSSCNPFVSLTQSTELPKKCICHGWCCVRPGSCLQLHVRGGAYGANFSLRTLCKLRTTRNCSSDVERR